MSTSRLDGESVEFTPHTYPPFPKDAQPVIELETFSLAKLKSDSQDQARLLEVCKTRGFFYLEFTDTAASYLSEDAENVARLAEQLFKLPLEDKLKYKYPENVKKPLSILGYKSAGHTRADAVGTPDTAEFFNIGKDDILGNPARIPTQLPPLVTEPQNRQLLARVQRTCHRIGLEIMSVLAKQLHLTADVFEGKHRISELSDDHIRLIRGPPRKSADLPEIQTPGHTDFGTITILFNWLGGLQVWSESDRGDFSSVQQKFEGTQTGEEIAKWMWVQPKPGHAIVNLGDAAVKFTGGILCSGRHRVVPSPGAQGYFPRYSVVYLLRPEDSCPFKRLEGGDIPKLKPGEDEEVFTGSQWIYRQSKMLRQGRAPSKIELADLSNGVDAEE